MAMLFVVNGKGGVGKDSFCDAVKETIGVEVRHISSITPIKELARIAGWDGGKELRDRTFLSDLKRLLVEYNDYPNEYCLNEFKKFEQEFGDGVMFVDIREPEEIEKFVKRTDGRARSILVRRDEIDGNFYGNSSDDNVFMYEYNYTFYNNGDIENLPVDAFNFMQEVIKAEEKLCLPHEF